MSQLFLLFCNVFLFFYYFIFNYNNMFFDKLYIIKISINTFLIITLLTLAYKKRYFLIEIFKKLKESAENERKN